jgi:hypothetical protein
MKGIITRLKLVVKQHYSYRTKNILTQLGITSWKITIENQTKKT